MKRILVLFAAAGIAASVFSTTVNLSTLSGNKILADGDTVTGVLSGLGYRVSIADGATVTLQNVYIVTNNVVDYKYDWAGITCEGDATIVLSGNNTVHGLGAGRPGIFVPPKKTLTIRGTGSLTAAGNTFSAGIGGGYEYYRDEDKTRAGNIVIEGGTIEAIGAEGAAGIGAGNCCVLSTGEDYTLGSITINGGNVRAIGGERGAGIGAGGGNGSYCGPVFINGGTVEATGGWGGAGIGSGREKCGDCEQVVITGGNVTAIGGEGAAGIGSGGFNGYADDKVYCDLVAIYGGNVTAIGGLKGAGIGSGHEACISKIEIYGGFVNATGGAGAAGIGSGHMGGQCRSITIKGGRINAVAGNQGAGIGSGSISKCDKVTIDGAARGCIVEATVAYKGGPQHIGYGAAGSCKNVVIGSGQVDTMSPDGFTRIIKWDGDLCWIEGDLTLYGGTELSGPQVITGSRIGNWKLSIANGAEVTLYNANITGLNNPDCKWAGITCEGDATINLMGENVVKGWHEDYPGIYVPKDSSLVIKGGGSLTASSNGKAAGIGGGNDMKCGNISIQGGRITATGGRWSAGIGGGYSNGTGACGSINIGSGINLVTATCGADCSNPIGKGAGGGSGGAVTVASGLNDTTSEKTRRIASGIVDLSGVDDYTASYPNGRVLTGTHSVDHRIRIANGMTVTLSGVNIPGKGNENYWPGIDCQGDATIILEGSNYVQGSSHCPGIYVPPDKTLTIKGSGILVAECAPGPYSPAAGIGGGKSIFKDCGNIVIESGTVIAKGGQNCPGIGGGENTSCGNITIGSGVTRVVAERGSVGTADCIGRSSGGPGSTCGEVVIDASLNVTTVGNVCTIFSRDLGAITEDTLMSDGAVLTGTLGVAAKISIAAGATVTLRNMDSSGLYGSDFAGLTCEGDATIVLEGKNRVDGYGNYPGIHVPPGCTLTIKGDGELTVNGGEYAAGIGAGKEINCGNIVIEGGTVNAKGGTWFAGIGCGYKATCGDITIKGGVVCATGGVQGPGIGSGDGGTCGNIVITGGSIEATGNSGAGIGRGGSGVCGNITISEAVTRLVATSGGSSSGYAINTSKDSTVTMAGMVGPVKHNPYVYPSFTSGAYLKRTLDQLGVAVPTDGTAYSVKAYGLPAGLKLKYNAAVKDKKGKVTKKAKSEWWIEGVPTASIDYDTNPVYLAVTVGGTTTLVPVELRVYAQEVTELDSLRVGVKIAQADWLEGVVSGWTVSGLPARLKYATKGIVGVTGTPKKAGLFTITAKKKKGTYYETKKFRVLVRPKDVDKSLFGSLGGKIDLAGTPILDWNLMNDVSSVGGKVAKVTGLPPGLTFAASTTYKDKKKTQVKQQGQTIVGTPTKVGKYVVTFTKNMKSGKKTIAKTAQIIWEIKAGMPPSMDFNTDGGEIVESSIALKHDGSFMEFTVSENAKVTAAGLPKGISLVALGGGKWGFKGYTVKAGTYLVTVKATMYGNTVTQRVALKVDGLPAWAKGSFPGYVANGAGDITGLATMSVTSAGKLSGKFTEDGKTWTFSVTSFTQSHGTYFLVPVTAKYAYKAKEKVNGKTKTVTKYLTRSFQFLVQSGMYGGEAYLMEQTTDGSLAQGQQNLWGSTYKKVGTKLFVSGKNKYKVYKADVIVDGKKSVLAVKVTTAGKATVTLTYDTGKKKKGKPVYYKPSCSTVVLPNSLSNVAPANFNGKVYIYLAPSAANNFPEIGSCLSILGNTLL